MPIYEYKCENGHVFEVIQKITEDSLTKCEECGAPAARVLYSPAVHFKGSGFYNTDYGKKKKGGGSGGSSEGTSESKGGDSGTSDSSKSDSKSDSKPAASTAD
jgi:putative FmdB family regulatory protein